MKQRSEIELRFEDLSEEYRRKFKKPYPLMITSGMTLEEACSDIQKCLRSEKAAPNKEYKGNADY